MQRNYLARTVEIVFIQNNHADSIIKFMSEKCNLDLFEDLQWASGRDR